MSNPLKDLGLEDLQAIAQEILKTVKVCLEVSYEV